MFDVGPCFVVALVICVMFDALGVWLPCSEDAGRVVCVASLCG